MWGWQHGEPPCLDHSSTRTQPTTTSPENKIVFTQFFSAFGPVRLDFISPQFSKLQDYSTCNNVRLCLTQNQDCSSQMNGTCYYSLFNGVESRIHYKYMVNFKFQYHPSIAQIRISLEKTGSFVNEPLI